MQINLKDENKGKMIANKIEDFWFGSYFYDYYDCPLRCGFLRFSSTSLFLLRFKKVQLV